MLKKTFSIFVASLFLILISLQPGYAIVTDNSEIQVDLTDSETQSVEVKAQSAILMEAETGKILMEMNSNEKVYPASITKIMTLLLVVEAIDCGKLSLTDSVVTSADAAEKGGSQIWLKVGEEMTVDELLKAAVVGSANDACVALAEKIAGSEESFVALMNERAKELEMNDTDFENCTGLDDTTESHMTTAHDVALMSRELLKHEIIFDYSTIWMDSLRNGDTMLVNTNKLVRTFEGITGLKTGTTQKAGPCVSATAKRDDMHLIAVVMKGENSDLRFNGAKAMLNWGFANWSVVKPEVDPLEIHPVKVLNGVEQDLIPTHQPPSSFIVQKGREGDVTREVNLPEDVKAPVEKGQILGEIIFKLDGETISKCDLTAVEAVEKINFSKAFMKLIMSLTEN